MNLSQKDLNHCIDSPINAQEKLEAACFYIYIKHGLPFPTYQKFAEFLGAYNYIPFPARAEINLEFAQVLLNLLKLKSNVTQHNLFLISHHCGIITNYSINTQSQVISWLMKFLTSTQESSDSHIPHS